MSPLLRVADDLGELGGDVVVHPEQHPQAFRRIGGDPIAEHPGFGVALFGQQGMELERRFPDDVIDGFW